MASRERDSRCGFDRVDCADPTSRAAAPGTCRLRFLAVIGRSVAGIEDFREVAPIAAVAGLRMASPWCRPDAADADGAVEVDDATLRGDVDVASAIAPWSRFSDSQLGRGGGAPHSSSEIGLRGISAPASGFRLGGRVLGTPGRSECTACPSRRRCVPVWCPDEGRRVKWADNVCFAVAVCPPKPAVFEVLEVFNCGVGSDKVLENSDFAPTPLALRLAWCSLGTWLGPRMASISSSDGTLPCNIADHPTLLLYATSPAHSLQTPSLSSHPVGLPLVSSLVAKGSLILDAPAAALACQH